VEREFWLERWRLNQIGFHQADHNRRLLRHWPSLNVPTEARVLVPLCGKTLDMRWLAAQGHSVVGVELAPAAVEAFFDEATAPYERRQRGAFSVYDGGGVTILCGDVFDLRSDDVDGVRGVFDRGALVALPPPMRRRYVDHLLSVLPVGAATLLLTLEYDQARADGPPFAVHGDEVEALYRRRCAIDVLERAPAAEMPPRFQALGIREASESTYRVVKTV
jgi:thiopurine S-methyltransferase